MGSRSAPFRTLRARQWQPAPRSARSRVCARARYLGRAPGSATSSRSRTPPLGAGAKANHLAYLGDAEVGAATNIGAGTITCNYDGLGKHRTEIGEGVFVGSNTALVAPVTVGAGAIIGAGSTITRDVPAGAVSTARGAQKDRDGGAVRLRGRQRRRQDRPGGGEKKS